MRAMGMRRARAGVAFGIVLVLAVGVVPAAAEDPPGGSKRGDAKPATRRVQGVRPWAFKRLERAHDALTKDDFKTARSALEELERNAGRLNDHERALTWQTLGYVQAAQQDYEGAAKSFEDSLASDGLPDAARNDVRYNLAQLYVILKRYDEAVATFEAWFDAVKDPPASAHYLLAMTYVQKEAHAEALPHARIAVEKTDEPKEVWLQLLLSLLIQQEQFADALPVVERLVARYPKKTYWVQLSAIHSRLGQQDKALAALEAAHEQDMLTTGDELLRLAQLYLYNGVPYRAARLLEGGLRSKTIPESPDTWGLLSNAWLQARERERALGPLEQAARLSHDSTLYVRLAQLQLDRGQWAAARASLTAALQKANLAKPGETYLLLGIANASEERWTEAREAFTAAQRHDATKEAATQWLATIDGEIAMAAAEAKARQ